MKKIFPLLFTFLLLLASVSASLPYWYETGYNGTVWVNLGNITANTNYTINISNSNIYPQKPYEVFSIFDDFNDNTLNTTLWDCRGDTFCKEENGSLVIERNNDRAIYMNDIYNMSGDFRILQRMMFKLGFDVNNAAYFGVNNNSDRLRVVDGGQVFVIQGFNSGIGITQGLNGKVSTFIQIGYPNGTVNVTYPSNVTKTDNVWGRYVQERYQNITRIAVLSNNESLNFDWYTTDLNDTLFYGQAMQRPNAQLLTDFVAISNHNYDLNISCSNNICVVRSPSNIEEATFNLSTSFDYQDLNISLVEDIPSLSIVNVSIIPEIIYFGDNLTGVCEVETYLNVTSPVINLTWFNNGVAITNNGFSPSSFDRSGTVLSGVVVDNYTLTPLKNEFEYSPSVSFIKNAPICGVNYRLELCGQVYQRSEGVFHSNYGISPYPSIGSFPFFINSSCILGGVVEAELTSQFACPSTGSAKIVFSENSLPLNTDTLPSYLYGDGDTITLQCSVLVDDLQDSLNESVIITIEEVAPSTVSIFEPFGSYTLNSTGQPLNISFSPSTGYPVPSYTVYFTNGVVNYLLLETPLNGFETIVTSSTVLLSGNYSLRVVANNSVGTSVAVGDSNIAFCINTWNETRTVCIDDLQTILYTDLFACSQQYDVPSDNGTIVSCDDGLFTDSELLNRELDQKQAVILIIAITLLLLFGCIALFLNQNIVMNIIGFLLLIAGGVLTFSSKGVLAIENFSVLWVLLSIFSVLLFTIGLAVLIAKLYK